jgi:glycosyltransferase involved in cell wall biosynthesis
MYPLTTLVLTPTLGVSPYLDETVRGVAALGIPTLHVISAPAGRLGELQERYPSTRVVEDAGKSGGIYGALNAGLKASPEGWEWFTYINDDDLLLPRFGELVLRHVGQPSPEAVAYGDVELVREDGRVVSRVTNERSPAWIPALLQQGISPLMQQGMLFNRESVVRLGGFETRYRLCADLDFWLRAYAGGDRFRHYALVAARFRMRKGQLSSETSRTIREQDEIVARLLPSRIPRALRTWARWRYRVCNLPRYLERIRSSGWRTSYELLASGASPSK